MRLLFSFVLLAALGCEEESSSDRGEELPYCIGTECYTDAEAEDEFCTIGNCFSRVIPAERTLYWEECSYATEDFEIFYILQDDLCPENSIICTAPDANEPRDRVKFCVGN